MLIQYCTLKRICLKLSCSVELFNCSKKSLYHSKKGESRAKVVKTSYNEALRKSLKSFGDYRLEYVPGKDDTNLVKNEAVKGEIVKSLNTLNKGEFTYKNIAYVLVKKGVMLFEIQNKKSNAVAGKIIQSGFKKDVFHIEFNDRKGFCYYGENENMIMEFMSSDNSVEMISLPRID